jgi:hypothetical protein
MKKILVMTALSALAGMGATFALAQDRADIDRTQIIGNRELPKVLYIVPWKKPMPGDVSGRPLVSVLDEALAPVDRDVFRRQVQYDGITQAQARATPAAQAPAAAAPGAPAAPAPSAATAAANPAPIR